MSRQADRLREAMAARRVPKLYALAVEIGVDESAVSRWRKGGAISVPHLTKLCEVLDISIDWLLLGRGTMDQHKLLRGSGLDPSLAAQLATLSPDAQHRLQQFLATAIGAA